MSVYPAPAPSRPRPCTVNSLRCLVHAVRVAFSSKSRSRSSIPSTKHVNGRPIGSPHPDEDTAAIGDQVGVDLNTAQQAFKSRSAPYLLDPPSSANSIRTFVSTNGRSKPFDTDSDSSLSIYSLPSSPTGPQVRIYYHTSVPSSAPVTERPAPSHPRLPQTPTRPQKGPLSVPPVHRRQQVQLPNHPYPISPPLPRRRPSYSRPTPAAYPNLAPSLSRHRSLPSVQFATPSRPAPPPDALLSPLPTNVPPPLPQRSPAAPATAGSYRHPRLRATVSTEGDILTMRRTATVDSTTSRPPRVRPYASSSTLCF